jgi:hypothetical protein
MLVATETTQANPGVIAIEPAEIRDISSGGSFSVNVTVTDVSEVYGWQVNITYNPQILNVDNVTEGTFLKQVNQTVFMKTIDNTGGYVLLSATFFPIPEHGVSGSGLLVQVAFSVKGSGSSSLHFVKDGTKLRKYIGDTVVPITDFSTTDASFRNASAGLFGEIPLEYLVVAVVVVVVIAGSSVFLLRRRRKKGLVR